MKKHTIIAAVASALAAGGIAQAQTSGDVAAVESNASLTTGVSLTTAASPGAVVTAIMSQPGSFGGHTYSSYAILAQDSSGGIELFGAEPGGDAYTPAVGDVVTATGEYDPFHGIPELENMTALSSAGTATVPTPAAYTIPQLNVTTLPSGISGTMVTLDDVTIVGASGNFPSANTSYTVEDGSGNEMTMYYYYTSYSVDGAMEGTPIPTGPVNIELLDSVYPTPAPGAPEFIPYSIVSAPEPTSTALAVMGGGAILLGLRRRK